jgi:hypothetical protein
MLRMFATNHNLLPEKNCVAVKIIIKKPFNIFKR